MTTVVVEALRVPGVVIGGTDVTCEVDCTIQVDEEQLVALLVTLEATRDGEIWIPFASNIVNLFPEELPFIQIKRGGTFRVRSADRVADESSYWGMMEGVWPVAAGPVTVRVKVSLLRRLQDGTSVGVPQTPAPDERTGLDTASLLILGG